MKWLPTICLLLPFYKGFTQTIHPAVHENPASLAASLIQDKPTDKEKVIAIFRWITENIAYYRPDPRTGRKKNPPQVQNNDFPEEPGELASLDERVARQVLRNRRAVCEGYARLFKALCHHAGIPARVLTGYARTNFTARDNRFRSNHTWNAVKIDSSWHLLDITWASGYIAWPSGEFVRQYDDYYFLTAPEKFVQHHYPDDPRWTLLIEQPVLPEFRQTPFRQKSFSKYSITAFSPAKGIIETAIGDTIQLELETGALERNMHIAPDSLWDPLSLIQNPGDAFVQPEVQISERSTVRYRFPVQSDNIKWLYVMYNNDAVLRYRLQYRKQEGTASTQ